MVTQSNTFNAKSKVSHACFPVIQTILIKKSNRRMSNYIKIPTAYYPLSNLYRINLAKKKTKTSSTFLAIQNASINQKKQTCRLNLKTQKPEENSWKTLTPLFYLESN